MSVEFEHDGGTVAVFYWETDTIAEGFVREVDGNTVAFDMAFFAPDLAAAPASAQLDSGSVVEVCCCYFVRCEFEGSYVPAYYARWEFDLDVSQEERDADSSESYSSAERVPCCYLGAGLEDIREFERDHAENGVVLAVALVPDGDGGNG